MPRFDPGFSMTEMNEIFLPEATVSAILEFESALALALAETGLVPKHHSEQVAKACQEPVADPESILAGAWESGSPVIAIRDMIAARLEDEEARATVHRGATTQDALDTARMLQSRRALAILDASGTEIARLLRDLVVAHRDQPQMGRTFLQDSRPTTFGARAAGWLLPILEHLTLVRAQARQLPVQLGGPSGHLNEYGGAATDVIHSLARRLDLQAPALPWHTDRSPIWTIARTVESLTRCQAKVGYDLAFLAQSSIGEVRLRPGGSSSMPGKRNPIDAVRAIAAATACHGFASMLTGAPVPELDRGLGGWHLEWLAFPMLFQTAAASGEATLDCLRFLEVDASVMASRVDEEGRRGLASVDRRLIDGVLSRFDEVMGSR